MKRYLTFLFLLTIHPAQAQEAWYLKMEPRFAEALVVKYQAKDKAPYLQALEKLPELIKQGKIKEIERVGVENAGLPDKQSKGGVHFPRRTVPRDDNGQEEFMDIGSSYQVREEAIYIGRAFEYRWQEGSNFTHLEINSQGRLPKEWMPTFMLETKEHTRLLLEKSPLSQDAFHEMKGRLSVSTDVPEKLAVTWLLTRKLQEVLTNRTEGLAAPLFIFRNGWDDVHKGSIRVMGTEVKWRFSKDKALEFLMENTSGKSGEYVHHRCKGEIQKPGVKQKTEILYHEERPNEIGGTEILNKKAKGFAEVVYQTNSP